MHRVATSAVALREEAQSLRDRKLALEAIIKEERNRRLQAAAPHKSTSPRASQEKHTEDLQPPGPTTAEPARAHTSATSPRASSSQQQQQQAAGKTSPHDLDAYRRELDSINGNTNMSRLHYYTNGHVNPADVNFYAAAGRVKECQRRALNPHHRPTSPLRKAVVPPRPQPPPSQRVEQPSPLLALPPPSHPLSSPSFLADGTLEPWTKSAVLRMRANQRVLRRIHEKEKREAAFEAARTASRDASTQRRPRATVVQSTPPVYHPPSPQVVVRVEEPPPEQTRRAPPSGSTSGAVAAPLPFTDYRRRHSEEVPSLSVPLPTRWSPPRRSSPPRTYVSGSPLRFRSADLSAGVSSTERSPPYTLRSSPFKPLLTYASSSSLRTSRHDPFVLASAAPRRNSSPWRPLRDSWTSPSRTPAGSASYQPIVPLPSSRQSTTPWESQRTWKNLVRRPSAVSPLKSRAESKAAEAVAVPVNTPIAPPQNVKPETVTVSPLTPSAGFSGKLEGAEEGADKNGSTSQSVEEVHHSSQKSSLLQGFRMPETVLKRDDLFQGST